jgi:hypothetical protein
MNISDEAVEAAAKAIFGDPSGETWGLQLPAVKERSREDARLALEAAAPHLIAARLVETVEELDALPEGVMVRTDTGFYLKEALRHGISTWVTTNERYYFKAEDVPLPATVIYAPRGSAGAGE